MKLIRIIFTLAALLSISASAPAPVQPTEPGVDAGFSMATVGTNGWYISDWTVYAVSPVLANGKLLQPGEHLTISSEGEHSIEFASPNGASRATQYVRIDKTPPSVSWNSPFNSEVTATTSGLSAEITDAGSEVCLIELSTDNGRNWIEGWNADGFGLSEPVHETTWNYAFGFPEFDNGAHVIILRARDCAGNTSMGKILVVQMSAKR